MATEKLLIDEFRFELMSKFIDLCRGNDYNKLTLLRIGETIDRIYEKYSLLRTVDAVEVDTVIQMFEYMLGDCPCNFSPVDEWLAERCELQNECPNPKDKRGCWKQFIKHFVAEMDGERKDNAR